MRYSENINVFAVLACLVWLLVMPEAPHCQEASRPEDGIVCSGSGVCRETATGLPFRILPRSLSHVYRGREAATDTIVRSNIRAFIPLYVFARELVVVSNPATPEGWYQIGETEKGPPLGWMQAVDVLEWKQALVVSYTHPGTGGEERQRVLMFHSKEDLMDLLNSPDSIARAVDVYRKLFRGELVGGLISKEPERFVDISKTFYLLPIVDFEIVDIAGDDARLLHLAAAVPQKRGADTLEDSEYRKAAMKKPLSPEDDGLQNLGIDVVFVMDMTLSMQPYIDRTKEAVAEIARRITQKRVRQRIRFGLVGYRDDVSKTPELAFTSKNFTPELVGMEEFIKILDSDARAAVVSSVGYPEEVFAGIDAALASRWNENHLRLMILVGDASSHPVGHEQNTTGKDAAMLRLAAEDAQIHIVSIHLKNPKHPEDHPLAVKQFGSLSRIRGKGEIAAMVEIDTGEQEAFQAAVAAVTESFSETLRMGLSGASDLLGWTETTAATAGNEPEPVAAARLAARQVTGAALVEYLGKEATPPKDILFWALDRDITNPAIQSLDVRVLINKRQLSDLILALSQVLKAMDRAEMSQMQFFEALQNVSGRTMKNPEEINFSGTLAQAGLLPAFIRSLPYRSEVLALNNEMYASFTAEQRTALYQSLRAKLQQYRDINEQVDGWVRLNDPDLDTDRMYPLHLDYLP